MKALIATIVGAFVGGAIGFMTPGLAFTYLKYIDPEFDGPGDSAGTIFALLMIVTIPIGMGFGTLFAGGLATGSRLFQEMSIGGIVGGFVGFALPFVLYTFFQSTAWILVTIPAGMGIGTLMAAAFGKGLRD